MTFQTGPKTIDGYSLIKFIGQTAIDRDQRILILIDQLDLYMSNEDFSVLRDFIPRLQKLPRQCSRVKVMVIAADVSVTEVITLDRKGY
jgi:hypothetical protein